MKLFNKIVKMTLPLFAIAALALVAAQAGASDSSVTTTSGGVYQGAFEGYIYGDNGSKSPVRLDLTHEGRYVIGKINLGKGLLVDGGRCGLAAVPSGTQTVQGQVSRMNSRLLDAATQFTVSGITVRLDLDSALSRDGESLEAQARIDLPWLCGRDPSITGVFERVS